ncbi:MAG: putative Xanthine dehydrogenase (yagR)molybdenum-binding subunit [Herbaspirillum sp.]|jgi:xanthine dehydrogenase YagR molybdenum-binding subunit|nr:putative Xanthine dehydrogenase (yagR)molybdenum-binding subunit [Herbaspirillum sp.]
MANDTSVHFGQAQPRIDARAKVTGAARYASDEEVANPAFAYLVTSAIARGRIERMDLNAARAVPGVLDILTHENVGNQATPPQQMDPTEKPTETLESDRIWHDGQIVAIVVADSFEAAREASHKFNIVYAQERPSASFDSPGASSEVRKETERSKDPKAGDFAGAYASAPVKVDARYSTPTQHHNAMELFTTTCIWDGPNLTVYEPTQTMHGNKNNLAAQLKIDPAMVRCVCRYVGGAFGSKSLAAHTVWIAIAARRLGRPVKLVPTRDQGFTIRTYRAETRHHLQLGADRGGKLIALRHEGWEMMSRPSHFNVSGGMSTARMYACPNIETKVNLVHGDRNSPGFMRAPPETPYMFALESAMDELAVALNMDPIALRRINDTQTDPTNGKAFSSRSLMQCYDQAAERFGWSRRDARPGSMRDGDWLIGWGCATACYPSNIGPAAARIALTAQGKASVALAGHEIGTGAYTLVAITAARTLGLKVEDITVTMGDSDLPPVPISGGSNNAASTAHATDMACQQARSRIAAAAVAANDSPFRGGDPASLRLEGGALVGPNGSEPLAKALSRVTGGVLEIYAEFVPQGAPPGALQTLYEGVPAFVGGHSRQDVTAFAFGAQFVEIRIHRRTKELRIARAVSAFASGTIVNATAARSQYMGGVIWGLSSALHEKTEVDLRTARYVNHNLADYLIPVNADTPSVEIIMVPEHDTRVNPLGIKGIGEIGIVGMNAAVANAVYHATGKRLRDMPVRLEDLL